MLLFDCETNGFLNEASRVHCLVIKDTETGTVYQCTDDEDNPDLMDIKNGLEYLMGFDGFVGAQNGIKFDVAVIQKLYPWFHIDESRFIDTLVLSRLIFPDLGERDSKLIAQNNGDDIRFPNKLWGSHSLKAWGWRLGVHKDTYAEETENAWEVFTPEMLSYCRTDVEVLHALHTYLTKDAYSKQAIELEHQIAWICARMERSGWPFDEKAAAELYSKLVLEREQIRVQMLETFQPIVIERVSEKTGKRLKDKVVEFNPASRKQIAERLVAKYGWKPKEFTPGGDAKVDEDILKRLEYPEAKTLAHYFMLEKRIGQIGEGEQAWLKLARNGHIHGSINTCGALGGRCTHQSPNLAQVPSVRALWGAECRRLFTVRPGFRMVGVDLSGLELRCLAHFMHQWDGGEYRQDVLIPKGEGDIHSVNQKAAGLATRDQGKTFIYAFLYGAGDEKIGSIAGKGRQQGKKLKEQFLDQIPALKKLKQAVTKAAERGYLIGLDGRKVPVRHAHAALNLLLQGAGALIAKRWVIECHLEAERRGWKYGWNGDFTMLGFIHDEVQWAVREGKEEAFGKLAVECAARAGEFFDFKCPIGAEYKTGMNWYDTH